MNNETLPGWVNNFKWTPFPQEQRTHYVEVPGGFLIRENSYQGLCVVFVSSPIQYVSRGAGITLKDLGIKE